MSSYFYGELYGDNRAILAGEVIKAPEPDHEVWGEQFFGMTVKTKRNSGASDEIPVIFSERLTDPSGIKQGDRVRICGQLRSAWSHGDEKRHHLMLFLFALEVEPAEQWDENEISLHGFVSKDPIFRNTPQGRDITDVTIAVNRRYNKSDYIPAIAWGRNAHYAASLVTGTEIEACGRIQSRAYRKKFSEDHVEDRVAYELSIGSIAIVAEPEGE